MSLNTYPYNPFPASTDKLDEAHNADLQAEVDQLKSNTEDLQEDVENLETDKTDTIVIAPAFDVEAGTYEVGDLVTYEGKLYEFTSAHSTAGAWDPTEVTEKTVADEISTVRSGLTNLLKKETATMTTGSSGWLSFPQGRIVISAYVDNYKTLIPYYRGDNNDFIGKVVIDSATSPATMSVLDISTSYNVTYFYI